MKRALLTLTLAVVASSTAEAVSISGGVGAWREKPSGWIEYANTSLSGVDTKVDVKDDLHLGDETKAFGWFKLSGIPIFPDVKVKYTPMSFTGSGATSKTFIFGDLIVPAGTQVASKLEANQFDITLTYGVPFIGFATAGRVSAEWGVNVKVIDGYARVRYLDPVTNQWQEDSKSATIPVPMLHVGGEIRPIELVSLSAGGNWIGYGGSSFYDWEAEVKVYPVKNLFVGVGYRYQRLKIDDISDVSSDLKVKGAFFEAGFTF